VSGTVTNVENAMRAPVSDMSRIVQSIEALRSS
jgi:hypothetical protein